MTLSGQQSDAGERSGAGRGAQCVPRLASSRQCVDDVPFSDSRLTRPRTTWYLSANPAGSTPITYDDALSQIAAVLQGNARAEILDAALGSDDGDGAALERLRAAMRGHSFPAASGRIELKRLVVTFDALTQNEGLHVLQGWDYVAHAFPDDIAPVLLLDYCARRGIPAHATRQTLAILLDQYFLTVLSLFAVRAWDSGNPNDNLDRVTHVLDTLQGPAGGGHRFVDDAETLLWLAISYYHPDERSYDALLGKVERLDAEHRLRVALPGAALLGSHLRWGLQFMYQRDVGLMRNDNVVDYPWLLFALVTLTREYARLHSAEVRGAERDAIAEAVLHGLSADPWAFTGTPPAFLRGHAAAHTEFRDLLGRHTTDLLADFHRLQPTAKSHSPLAFACNFPANAAVAMVALALGDNSPHPSLNGLFMRKPSDGAAAALKSETAGSVAHYARRLMEYSRDPARLDARGAPLIVYDPYDAIHCYNAVVRTVAPGTA